MLAKMVAMTILMYMGSKLFYGSWTSDVPFSWYLPKSTLANLVSMTSLINKCWPRWSQWHSWWICVRSYCKERSAWNRYILQGWGSNLVWGDFILSWYRMLSFELGGHMRYQNNHLEEIFPTYIFSISGSTISVSGLRVSAFFSLVVGSTDKCHLYEHP